MTHRHAYHPQRDMDAIAKADARLDSADDRRIARLADQGYTHSRCNRCHDVRVLRWEGGECNNYSAENESGMCEGVYRPAGEHA